MLVQELGSALFVDSLHLNYVNPSTPDFWHKVDEGSKSPTGEGQESDFLDLPNLLLVPCPRKPHPLRRWLR
jgi:hypothetical protein